ncbi:hypothetical protein [Leptolyngbya sp. 7M]|uniref:hypothetical protein n=1 Tax=Leptolyngbya sp. 7M TaxID=2812896 RepID=UPI001B8B5971|nr:hypothetical protein [Leptolyngbya sp. 7M]QYO64838.1 hypothetical protein JVX88_35630 [Leptolyngbya sp. 7M]
MVSISHQAWQDSGGERGEFVQTDPFDSLDLTWFHPNDIEQGIMRSIHLREGLKLEILDVPLGYESSSVQSETLCDQMEFHFHLQGYHEDGLTRVGNREFCIRGIGVDPKHCLYSPEGKALEVWLWVEVEVLRSFLGAGSRELPPEIAHWGRIRPASAACR